MSKQVDLAASRRKLARLWGAVSALLTLFLIAQSAANVFGGQMNRAWEWFLPCVLPTMTLIFGTIALQGKLPPARQKVDGFAYSWAFWSSVFYLVVLTGTLLLQRASSEITALQWLDRSRIFLAAIQGVVVLAVSMFFQASDGASGGGQ